MTMIGGIGAGGAAWSGRKAGRAGSRFSLPLGHPAEAAEAGDVATTATAAFGSILTLQENGPETVDDRRARFRGQDLLRALAGLQRAMLAGPDHSGSLQQLSALVTDLPEATDPGLRGLVDAIALRARVELARRGL
jgi:hypothetical protein